MYSQKIQDNLQIIEYYTILLEKYDMVKLPVLGYSLNNHLLPYLFVSSERISSSLFVIRSTQIVFDLTTQCQVGMSSWGRSD